MFYLRTANPETRFWIFSRKVDFCESAFPCVPCSWWLISGPAAQNKEMWKNLTWGADWSPAWENSNNDDNVDHAWLKHTMAAIKIHTKHTRKADDIIQMLIFFDVLWYVDRWLNLYLQLQRNSKQSTDPRHPREEGTLFWINFDTIKMQKTNSKFRWITYCRLNIKVVFSHFM